MTLFETAISYQIIGGFCFQQRARSSGHAVTRRQEGVEPSQTRLVRTGKHSVKTNGTCKTYL